MPQDPPPSPFPSWPRGQTIAIINRLGCISLAFPLLTFAGGVVRHSERGLTSLAQLTDERPRLLRSRRETGAISVSLLQSIGSVGSCAQTTSFFKGASFVGLIVLCCAPLGSDQPRGLFPTLSFSVDAFLSLRCPPGEWGAREEEKGLYVLTASLFGSAGDEERGG